MSKPYTIATEVEITQNQSSHWAGKEKSEGWLWRKVSTFCPISLPVHCCTRHKSHVSLEIVLLFHSTSMEISAAHTSLLVLCIFPPYFFFIAGPLLINLTHLYACTLSFFFFFFLTWLKSDYKKLQDFAHFKILWVWGYRIREFKLSN